MGLRSLAHSDLTDIMHDEDSGCCDITITNPDGDEVVFSGWVNDIFLATDPGTGETVSGRQCTASLLIYDLIDAGFQAVKGVPEATKRPWLVSFADVNGVESLFKVVQSNPDRGIGLNVLFLEEYKQ